MRKPITLIISKCNHRANEICKIAIRHGAIVTNEKVIALKGEMAKIVKEEINQNKKAGIELGLIPDESELEVDSYLYQFC